LTCLTAAAALAQDRRSGDRAYPPELPGATVEVYKTVGDVKLNVYIFTPPGHQATDKTPAIVFFFGGGWKSGSPGQFLNQCRYLASRGMVAMTADYRVLSRHGTPAVKCVADAKSAIRWVRANAGRLGVDPDHIAAGGGSAGGHIAACTGTIDGLDEPGEDASINSKPNAMVLFNPALALAPDDGGKPLDEERMAGMRERAGIDPAAISPLHQVKQGDPPTIIFHGTADTTVPFWTAERFAEKMTQAGNTCRLVPAEGQMHGFFNHGRGDNKWFKETLRAADKFLAGLGFLQGEPTIDRFE
jgi:acetyl esterase/lipase